MKGDAELLLEQLNLSPADETLLMAYADALMEEGIPSWEARGRAALARTAAIRAGELREATHLMRGGSRTGSYYTGYVLRWCGITSRTSTWVMLVAGNDPPRYYTVADPRADAPTRRPSVTVGAGWLMRHHYERHQRINADRRRNRLKKKQK
jgi:uncharacterized protein (TIGR02996 family)